MGGRLTGTERHESAEAERGCASPDQRPERAMAHTARRRHCACVVEHEDFHDVTDNRAHGTVTAAADNSRRTLAPRSIANFSFHFGGSRERHTSRSRKRTHTHAERDYSLSQNLLSCK